MSDGPPPGIGGMCIAFFLELVKLAKEKEWFPTAERDVAGRPCIPVELKVGVGFSTRCCMMGPGLELQHTRCFEKSLATF